MSDSPRTATWLPSSIVDAATDRRPDDIDRAPREAWSHLLERLGAAADLTVSNAAVGNDADITAGVRHLLVLLAVGSEEILRNSPDPVLRVTRASMDDILTWGMECPDGVYCNASLQAGGEYHVWGNRGTARYVGLQTMNGMASTANSLVDELDVGADGTFDLYLSPERRAGNWMPIEGAHPTLNVRHFFYDWESETRSSLHIEKIGGFDSAATEPTVEPGVAMSRQIGALGDFVFDNLKFFLDFGTAPPANDFLPPADLSAMGAAKENQVAIGRYRLEPDQALIAAVRPPAGLYWSFSLGNPWWETVHYGRHQSSLNGHQAIIDDDGFVRVVISARDPGVANWLDTAGHSNGPIIQRCVRTEPAAKPECTVVPVDEVGAHLPAATARVTPEVRARTLAARRLAVHARFAR